MITELLDPLIGELPYNALGGPQTVDNTGVTAADVALQANMNAAAAVVKTHMPNPYDATSMPVAEDFYIPAGEYKINNPLQWPQGLNIKMSPAAKIKAGGSMDHLLDTAVGTLHANERLEGGIFDGNAGLSSIGIVPRYFAHLELLNVTVIDCGTYHIVGGDPAAVNVPYELTLQNIHTLRTRGAAFTPTYGVWLRSCTDTSLRDSVVTGAATGVRNELDSDLLAQGVHCWASNLIMTTCFDDNTFGSRYVSCTADSPTAYGWRFRTGSGNIVNGRALLSTTSTDNVSIVVHSDNATAGFNVYGIRIDGATGPIRWALDFDATNLNFCDIFGVAQGASACATFAFGSSGLRSQFRALRLVNESNTAFLNSQRPSGSTSDWLQFNDSSSAITKGFRVDQFGTVKSGAYTTATRPAATAVSAGAEYFDTTLNKPGWSDGTNWRDASGTII